MTALKVSGNNLVRSNGRLVTVTGTEERAQKLEIALKYVLGEWFLDQGVGFPWFERIFIKNPQPSEIVSTLRKAILSSPGIASVDVLTYDFDSATRKLRVQFKAFDTDGNEIDFDRAFTPFAQDTE